MKKQKARDWTPAGEDNFGGGWTGPFFAFAVASAARKIDALVL